MSVALFLRIRISPCLPVCLSVSPPPCSPFPLSVSFAIISNHCSLGGRYSSRSSVPTIFRMQLSQPRWHRSPSSCSQTSQMMVDKRFPSTNVDSRHGTENTLHKHVSDLAGACDWVRLSQMMVGGRTPCADSGRSSFFSQRGQTSSSPQTSSSSAFSTRMSITSGAGRFTHSSSSSSSSAATNAAAATAAPNDVSSTSLAHYIYEHCRSATLVLFCNKLPPPNHRRSQDFVWSALFLAKKVFNLFYRPSKTV